MLFKAGDAAVVSTRISWRERVQRSGALNFSSYDIPVWGASGHAADAWQQGRYLDSFIWEVNGFGEMFGAEMLYKFAATKLSMLYASRQAARGWKIGQSITNLTAKGNVPAWSTVRQRFWKNETVLNSSAYSESNLLRMEEGLAPQRLNPNTGLMESMELHHHLVPQRDGGLFDFIKVWPDEHRMLDPFRR